MENKKTEKKLARTKTYKITWDIFNDGSTHLCRENDGFSVIELIGISTLITQDMNKIIENMMEFDSIERKSTNAKLIDNE